DLPVLAALLVVVVLALIAYRIIRIKRELALPIAWLVVWLLPVLNLWALDPQLMVTDRYLFLPALALPWLVLTLAPRGVALVVLTVLAVVFGALSLRYAAIFADERTFVAAMERAQPTSAFIAGERARLLLRDDKPAEAEAALRRAVELDPLDSQGWRTLGDLHARRGDLDGA